tara:strand:- start:2644 stop:3915 length:1272 start_codon:yes stop_codon:yes gene_type:complete
MSELLNQKYPLWLQMVVAMVAGLAVGLALSPQAAALVSSDTALMIGDWLSLPGMLFLALIKMIVVPLVAASITLAITGSQNMTAFRKNGTKAGLYFVATTCISVLIGILLVEWVRPGQYIDPAMLLTPETLQNRGKIPDMGQTSSLPDMIAGIFPTNPIKSIVEFNMLHVVVASILAGVAILSLEKKKTKPVTDMLQAVLDISMQIVYGAMYLAPLAVFGFLADLAIQVGADTLTALSAYMGTVILGLLCVLGLYLFIVFFVAGRSPLVFLRDIRDAQILAFSTSSSAATMPLSLQVAEERLKIKPAVARFIVPMGTTINMDGTAIYQIIAGLFLAQVFGIDLTLVQMIVLSVTIVGASIGSPGSPGVGLVILATILTSIGISPEGVAMILAVDRILDMCRTTINVTGDLTAATVMNKWMNAK